MPSIKEILEKSAVNVTEAAYLVADIMKLRGQHPTYQLSESENKLSDIMRYTGNRSAYDASQLTQDASKFPTNMRFLADYGVGWGTGTAYGIESSHIYPKSEVAAISNQVRPDFVMASTALENGTTVTCRGYEMRINPETMRFEYCTITGTHLGESHIWLEIPAFSGMTPIFMMSSDDFFIAGCGVGESGVEIRLSTDLWNCSKGALIAMDSSWYETCLPYVDAFGRIYQLANLISNEDPSWAYAVYDNIFKSAEPKKGGISYHTLYGDDSPIDSAEFVENSDTHELWLFDNTHQLVYLIIMNTSSDGTPYFEIPGRVMGSIYIDQQVIEVQGLGFVPDKVFLCFRGTTEMWDKVKYTHMTLSSEMDLRPVDENIVGISYHSSIDDESKNMVSGIAKTIVGDVNSTRYGGYISGDSFVINVPVEYIGGFFDYLAVGKAMGNDPYLS